jgi:hypothetical protein
MSSLACKSKWTPKKQSARRSFSAAPRFPSNSSQDDKLMLLAVSGEHNAHDKYTEKETTHDK